VFPKQSTSVNLVAVATIGVTGNGRILNRNNHWHQLPENVRPGVSPVKLPEGSTRGINYWSTNDSVNSVTPLVVVNCTEIAVVQQLWDLKVKI
jgi:hypothetical protein